MRAAILTELRAPLEIDEVRPPDSLGFGQVRVRVAYSGICGSQLGEIDGVKGPDAHLPHLLGHEGSGHVLEIGEGVTRVAPGDRVVLHWMPGPGIGSAPPSYARDGRRVNAGWVTTFNDEAVVSENRVTPLPDGIALDLAPLLGCAVTTGLGVIVNDAQVRIGESVVVFGVGGVGLCAVQGAAMVSGNPVIAIDLHLSRLELASRIGATHTVDASKGDAEAGVREILGSDGADVVIENTGNPRVIELAYELTAPSGRTVLVGVPPRDDLPRIFTLPLHFGKTLTGSKGGGARPEVDIPRYAGLAKAGRLALEPLITDRYPLERVNDAIEDLRAGRVAGRCLIDMTPYKESG
jgi:S-(hydroxymethyl)glutathione dehydrogenase/alcohol dehydrogenase